MHILEVISRNLAKLISRNQVLSPCDQWAFPLCIVVSMWRRTRKSASCVDRWVHRQVVRLRHRPTLPNTHCCITNIIWIHHEQSTRQSLCQHIRWGIDWHCFFRKGVLIWHKLSELDWDPAVLIKYQAKNLFFAFTWLTRLSTDVQKSSFPNVAKWIALFFVDRFPFYCGLIVVTRSPKVKCLM